MVEGDQIVSLGVLMIVIGFVLTFVGALFSSFSGNGGSNVESGGVVLIGPIPIAFGSSGEAVKIAMFLALAVMVVWFLFTLFAK